MNLYLAAERKPVIGIFRRWWKQLALGILGIKAGNAATEGGEEMGEE